MLFWDIFTVIGGSRYPKRSVKPISIGYVSPPNIGTLTPPMHDQYNFSYFITRNCNITRPFPTPFIQYQQKPYLLCFCVPPNSMTCICLWFFIMLIFRIHVSFWFILHRSVKVASKLVQNLAVMSGQKSIFKLPFLSPWYPLSIFLDFSIFINVDHVKWNRMPFEFWKSARWISIYQGGS